MLSVVPHQWVRGNVLLWPGKHAGVLCKDVCSKPAASWTKLPCVVKRKYIPTYTEAEQEAADLSGMSTDVSDYAPRKKQKKNPKKVASKKGYDFNHLLSQGMFSVDIKCVLKQITDDFAMMQRVHRFNIIRNMQLTRIPSN